MRTGFAEELVLQPSTFLPSSPNTMGLRSESSDSMSDVSSTHAGLSRLLRETFSNLDLNESACLVGILYETDILFLGATLSLPALEPKEASALVAVLYGHDANRLLKRFHSQWGKWRNSPGAAAMLDALSANEFVDRMVPYQTGDP